MKIQIQVNLILFSLIPVVTTGQIISFSLQGNVSYTNPVEKNSYHGDSTYFFQHLNDSIAIRTRGFYEAINLLKYTTTPGFQFIPRIHLAFNQRFSLALGMGAEYMTFTRKENYIYSRFSGVSGPGDTINTKSIFDPPVMVCDVYENSIQDLLPLQEGTDYTFINLLIPIEFSYQLVADKLSLNTGLFLQTPLYNVSVKESIVQNIRTENGKTICRYVVGKTENKNNNAKNALLGISCSLTYRFADNFSLHGGIYKTMDNIFHVTNLNSIIFENHLNPLRFTLGLQYHFGSYIKTTASN